MPETTIWGPRTLLLIHRSRFNIDVSCNDKSRMIDFNFIDYGRQTTTGSRSTYIVASGLRPALVEKLQNETTIRNTQP